MKEMYFAYLNELHQKVALRLQQHETVTPPAKQLELFEKMKKLKYMLEHAIGFLQIDKSNIQPSMKEKLPMYEKQIMRILTSSRSKKIAPSQQQGQQQFQHPGGYAQSMPQQQPSQVSQLQHRDNHVNQAKQMNLQGSVAVMQSAPVPNTQHGSLSTHVTAPSPIPGDSEKPSGISTVTNAINVGHQQTTLAPPQNQSLAVGTPEISASPLLAEFTSPEGSDVNASTAFLGKRKKVMNPKDPTFTCPVCRNELVESCSTICGHIFCQGCIKMTVQKLKKCPMCTRALTMKNFHRVYLPTIEFNIDSP